MIALILTLGLAQAADPEFVGTDKEGAEAEEAEGTLSAELGGTWTTGNTDTYTLSAGVNGGYKWSRNKVGLVAGTLLGKSRVDANGDGILDDDERALERTETARKAFADARYDRYVSDRTSLYVLAGALVAADLGEVRRQVGTCDIDTCRGTEKAPGIKDFRLVREFIAAARNQEVGRAS